MIGVQDTTAAVAGHAGRLGATVVCSNGLAAQDEQERSAPPSFCSVRSNMRLPSGGAVRLVRGTSRSAAHLSAGASKEGKQASDDSCQGEGVGLHRTVGSVGVFVAVGRNREEGAVGNLEWR